MRNEHWRTWSCPLGCQQAFATTRDFDAHISNVHPKHDTPGSRQSLQALGMSPDLKGAKGVCPLCLDVKIGTDRQYSTHVADHLESLALFALPDTGMAPEEEDSQSEEGAQSLPSSPGEISQKQLQELSERLEAAPLQERRMSNFSFWGIASDSRKNKGDKASASDVSRPMSFAFEGKSTHLSASKDERMVAMKVILTGRIMH